MYKWQMLKICQSKDYTEMDSQNKNAWNNLWMRWMNLTIYFTKGFLLVIVLGPVLKGLHALCTGSKFKQRLNSNSCISHSIGFKELIIRNHSLSILRWSLQSFFIIILSSWIISNTCWIRLKKKHASMMKLLNYICFN